MTNSSGSQRRQSPGEVAFALGNLLPALLLGAGTYALPLRFWGLDLPIVLLILWLLGTSALALGNPRWTRRALRLGAAGLLAVGLVLFALFALSLAFLSGIHGSFGDLGEVLMALVLALVVPYTLAYPVIELLWLGSRTRSTTPSFTEPLPSDGHAGPPAESSSAPSSVGLPRVGG